MNSEMSFEALQQHAETERLGDDSLIGMDRADHSIPQGGLSRGLAYHIPTAPIQQARAVPNVLRRQMRSSA